MKYACLDLDRLSHLHRANPIQGLECASSVAQPRLTDIFKVLMRG